MSTTCCDLCGKSHTIKDCDLLSSNKKHAESCYHIKTSMSLAFQTLPNWICMVENKKKMLTLREIEKFTKFGPVLGPHSSSPKKNAEFPLCIQVAEVRLWIDQTDENNSNWLSLVPISPQNHNMIACQIDENIYYIASKDIKVSEELYVWYAPFYKIKLPSNIYEKILDLHNMNKNEKENEVEAIFKPDGESVAVSLAYKSDFHNSSILNNNLSFLNEVPFLDNIYIANSGLDATHLQPLSSNKVIATVNPPSCSISSSNSRSAGTSQSVIFVSPPFQSFTFEPNLSSLSFIASKPEVNVSQNSSTFRLTEQDLGSLLSERGKDLSELITSDEGKKRSAGDLIKQKELNLNNLQSINIKNSELTFTYKFNKKDIGDTDIVSEKQDHNLIKSSEKASQNSKNKIIIKTGNKQDPKGKQLVIKNSLNNFPGIQVSEAEKVNEDSMEVDIITLNVSDNLRDSNNVPVSKVLRRAGVKVNISSLHDDATKEHDKINENFVCNTTIKPWTCNQCEETHFETKLSFILHLKNHLGAHIKRKYICHRCGLHFKSLDVLRRHSRVHASGPCSNDGLGKISGLDCQLKKVTKKKENQESTQRSWKGHFSCQICLKKFQNAKLLLNHLSKHSGDFFCSLCKKEFTRKENFKTHLCVQRLENQWKCEICKKRFTNSRSFELHTLEHNEKVKCNLCSQIFLSESNLQFHQDKWCRKESSSTEMLKFSCHICCRSFSSLVHLEDHVTFCKQLDIVNNTGEVNCEQCGDGCRNPLELRLHHEKHTYPYLCIHCSQRFRTRGTYERHICGVDFTCDLCNTTMRSLQELFKHITLHGPPPSCCPQCHFPFYKMDNTKVHQCKLETQNKNEENNKKKVRCYFCLSLFASEHNLKKHMASLHDIPVQQKFVCGKCGKNFHRSDLLKNHENVHLAPSLECLECHKKFRNKKSFDLHTALHKGDFRFTCKVCSKGFTQKKYLHRHEKIHKSSLRVADSDSVKTSSGLEGFFTNDEREFSLEKLEQRS